MRIAFFAVLVAVLGAALPGHAARSCALSPSAGRRFIDIDVLENGFSPFTQQVNAGDVIRWTMRGSQAQKLAPFAPENVPGFGALDIEPGDVICISFPGGSIWYRDAKSQYSVVDKDTGVCHGRCASISDRKVDPAPPAIIPLGGPSDQKPTFITGTAEPLVLVKVAKVPDGETAYDKGTPLGQALADQSGNWKAKLFIDGGSYNLVARATDAGGRESDDSSAAAGGSTVRLEVIQDTEPPVLTVNKPTPPVILGDSPVTGSATDNSRISQVQVIISDPRDGSDVLGDSGRVTVTIPQSKLTCAPEPTCPPTGGGWSFLLKPAMRFKVLAPGQTQPTEFSIPGGVYHIQVKAFDAWGLASTVETFDVVVVPLPRLG